MIMRPFCVLVWKWEKGFGYHGWLSASYFNVAWHEMAYPFIRGLNFEAEFFSVFSPWKLVFCNSHRKTHYFFLWYNKRNPIETDMLVAFYWKKTNKSQQLHKWLVGKRFASENLAASEGKGKCSVINGRVFVHHFVVDIFQFIVYADREQSLNGMWRKIHWKHSLHHF